MSSTQTLALLTPEDIRTRVMTSNSFSKAEMAGHRSQITDARASKRKELSDWDGAKLGSFASEAMKAGAVLKDIRTVGSSKQQTWTIKLVAPVHRTPQEAMQFKLRAAAKRLNDLEEQAKLLLKPTK